MRQGHRRRVRQLLAATALGAMGAAIATQTALAAAADAPTSAAAGAQGPATVGEVIVTANRRAQDVTKIPYNISAVGSEQINRLGITSLESLSSVVPNLNFNSSGAANIGAERPVMRGLNASPGDRAGQALEQSPVALYLGNVPTGGDFPIDDVARVEVLRGPQGTLYGAGALGGTIRLIPNDPKLNVYEGSIDGSVGGVAHSTDADYSVQGVVNVPVGDTFALRISAKHEYDAGFIDQIGVFKRQWNSPVAPPVLANPSDVAGSAPVTYNIPNSNWTRIDSVRTSAKWAPTDKLSIVAAYNYVQYSGWGTAQDNPSYQGGPDPLSPSTIYPATHDDQVVLRDQLPYARESQMESLDVSYDLGFATLSSTTSYYHTHGDNWYDTSYGVLALPAAYLSYYTGNPADPRYNNVTDFHDADETTTQEVRLVSKTKSSIEYTVGFYYQTESRDDDWLLYLPGGAAQAQASGCDCVFTGPNGLNSNTDTHTHFSDTAIYGDLTWHVTDRLMLTGGARFFWDTFSRTLNDQSYLFGFAINDTNSTAYHHQLFKANASYEYLAGQQVYTTFSQGFRRGGANAFATSGPLTEPASIEDFAPDTVNNYEFGFKGRVLGGLRYSVDGFYDQWSKPQIGGITPYNGWPVVVNGSEAVSKGVELEISGPITHDLSYSLGYAYADAKLTKNFCIPAGDGAGDIIPCATQGLAGTVLPGAPKNTFSGELNYTHTLGGGNVLEGTLNADYKGGEFVELPSPNLLNPYLPGYWTVNLSGAWDHGPWRLGFYVHNLLNSRGLVGADVRYAAFLGNLQFVDQITKPLSGGLTLGYRW